MLITKALNLHQSSFQKLSLKNYKNKKIIVLFVHVHVRVCLCVGRGVCTLIERKLSGAKHESPTSGNFNYNKRRAPLKVVICTVRFPPLSRVVLVNNEDKESASTIEGTKCRDRSVRFPQLKALAIAHFIIHGTWKN